MPELAEVFYYAAQWEVGVGQPITEMHLHAQKRVFRSCDVAGLKKGLPGQKLLKIRTHGKQMLFSFTHGHWLTIHLGMTGDMSAQPPAYEPGKHDHLVLITRKTALVFTDPRQFGSIRYHESKEMPEAWQDLPPQPMEKGFTMDRLRTILQRHAKAPLKMLLLDQSYFPGVGNWMADEVMWQILLRPQTLAGALQEKHVKALHKALQKVCTGALKTVGKDWSDPPKSWLFSHRWSKGHHCPRCGTSLVRDTLRGRTACWCPQCQKEI